MNVLADAAKEYANKKGWLTIPLVLDADGFPKKPITDGWPDLDLIEALALDFSYARGIGIVLGAASKNLAVMDIDDPEAAEEAFLYCKHTYCVRTIRKRGHIYVIEETPSPSSASMIHWRGRQFKVELKAKGTQVAAPPTPGYAVVSDVPPKLVPSIGEAWDGLAARLGIVMEHQRAGYPAPWQETVQEGGRNMSAYIEAHKLREAGLPYALTLEHLRFRWETHYAAGGQDWAEIERTIQSAYRKGEVRLITTGVRGLK